MAKLINILAASVGSGIMLGAGIRLGEALANRDAAPRREPEGAGKFALRLDGLEERLLHLESNGAAGSLEKQTSELAAIRSQVAAGEGKIEDLRGVSRRLRGELQGWLEDTVTTRLADLESKLKAETAHTQQQMLDAFVEGVQTRVMHRIAKLEQEVAGQSAAMTELRECSLRTEQSVQKLLGGLDRLIVDRQTPPPADQAAETGARNSTPAPAVETPESSGQPAAAEPEPVAEPPAPVLVAPRSRRWSIFG